MIKLAQDTLATVSKDLQVAAWLTEALLDTEHFAGLYRGITLSHNLLSQFWDTVYPLIEDGDRELRAKPLAWLGSFLDFPLHSVPLVNAGYSWFVYKDSRIVGYEDQVKTDKDRKSRNNMIEEGKLAPEVFDKAFAETPKAFYLRPRRILTHAWRRWHSLTACATRSLRTMLLAWASSRTALTEVRQTVHSVA